MLRMFDPMLVYQTFEDTTLTDVKNLDALNRLSTHASWKHVRRINKWSEDPITKQPVSYSSYSFLIADVLCNAPETV